MIESVSDRTPRSSTLGQTGSRTVDGQGLKGGYLRPDDTDPSGRSLMRLELDDDTEGQGAGYGGLGQTEEDVEGHRLLNRPSVD